MLTVFEDGWAVMTGGRAALTATEVPALADPTVFETTTE
jgi:hypothetical protein